MYNDKLKNGVGRERPAKIRGAVTRLRRVVRLPVSTVEPCRAERGPLTRRETPGFKIGDIKQNNYKKEIKNKIEEIIKTKTTHKQASSKATKLDQPHIENSERGEQ